MKNEITLTELEEEYAKVFQELSVQRTIDGTVVGPIPYTQIESYLTLHSEYDVDEFVYCITQMDAVYSSLLSEKIKRDMEAHQNKMKAEARLNRNR